MEAQLKGAVLIALVVGPQWWCPILKPLSAKVPPKSETAPHQGWQDGTILEPGNSLGGERESFAILQYTRLAGKAEVKGHHVDLRGGLPGGAPIQGPRRRSRGRRSKERLPLLLTLCVQLLEVQLTTGKVT